MRRILIPSTISSFSTSVSSSLLRCCERIVFGVYSFPLPFTYVDFHALAVPSFTWEHFNVEKVSNNQIHLKAYLQLFVLANGGWLDQSVTGQSEYDWLLNFNIPWGSHILVFAVHYLSPDWLSRPSVWLHASQRNLTMAAHPYTREIYEHVDWEY